MDSIRDLLAGRDYDQPEPVEAIKHYVRDKYQVEVGVQLAQRGVIISVPSAALASRLRYDIVNLQKAANTDLRISFRING